MTPIEKAESALNARIERLQANLRDTKSEAAQRFLVQALVVCIGLGETLNAYIKAIGAFAQGRHGELKQEQDTLTTQHAELLKAGNQLLELLRANPTDQAIRKEIERAQQGMATIQKVLKRGANALQRDVAPSLAMIDKLGESLRRLAETDQLDALKRVTKGVIVLAEELYRSQPGLPAKEIIDPITWEMSALAEIDQATDFHEAYARAGYQAMLALDVMTMAVSPTPPQTAEELTQRANASVGERLKGITARFA